jgi:muramoyltetrapeptide carboxypeptidase LdcA involved in peptidoglycan recycling
MYFTHAGVMSYYGANLLTPIAQPGGIDAYTEQAIWRTLFSDDVIGTILPCDRYTKIEWQDIKAEDIEWTENSGYELLQGNGVERGRLCGGCGGPLQQIMGTSIYPNQDIWRDSLLFLESYSPYGSVLAGLHELRALNASGMFQNAKGLITPHLSNEEKAMLLKFLKYEAERDDMPVLTNVDFGHRTPMTILPIGAMAEINCNNATFSILESGVE